MEKIKSKYEIILGFVTLVISLSAFKDELSKITLELGYAKISLSEYFLWVVFGFSICLYLYIIEKVSQDSKIGSWKIFNYILYLAYFLFAFILLTPFLITTNILLFKLYKIIPEDIDVLSHLLFFILNLVSALTFSFISYLISKFYLIERKRNIQEQIEVQEIKDLDNAVRLFADGYFSHSVLESYKVLEGHLYKKITEKNIRVARHRFNDILEIAIRENIIGQEDLPTINDIRGMRNVAAHSDTQYTKDQAEFALKYVKQLIKRK